MPPPGSSRGRRARLILSLVGIALLAAGCGTARTPSMLDTKGPKAAVAAMDWWILFGISCAVCILVIALAMRAVISRRRADTEVKSGEGTRFVLMLGVVFPSIVLAGTFALSLGSMAMNAKPPSPTHMTIDIVGHRWWWEVKYPTSGAVTANEIHIPVDTPVELRLRTADVIHSLWAPQLMPKMDLLPRRINQTWIQADHIGTYRGQCAEYCGAQHAHMAFTVVAQSRSKFEVWLHDQSQPAATPTTDLQRRGRQIVTTSTCATCHTVRGTSADGHVGPDLTHVGARKRLAAETIPNNVGNMSGWVSDSQTIKPGNLMPPQRQLSADDLRAVVAYLQSLK